MQAARRVKVGHSWQSGQREPLGMQGQAKIQLTVQPTAFFFFFASDAAVCQCRIVGNHPLRILPFYCTECTVLPTILDQGPAQLKLTLAVLSHVKLLMSMTMMCAATFAQLELIH